MLAARSAVLARMVRPLGAPLPSISPLSSDCQEFNTEGSFQFVVGGRRLMSSQSRPDKSESTFNFEQVRTRVASMLASAATALDPTSGAQVLEDLGAIPKTRHDEVVRKSVSEQVAEIKMIEAENARREAKVYMESELSKVRKEAFENAEKEHGDRLMEALKSAEEAAARRQELEQQLHEAAAAAAEDAPGDLDADGATGSDPSCSHPILGAPVLDLQYKKVFLLDAETLSALPVWEKQRIYRHDRAKAIANDKMKNPQHGLPGVITLYETKSGGLYVLDGQHRVGAIGLIASNMAHPGSSNKTVGFDVSKILVEVFSVPDSLPKKERDRYAEDLFTEINKAEPIKLVDMPGMATSNENKVITAAVDGLAVKYKKMFSTSTRCKPPHVNIDNLRDAIFAADVLKKNGIRSDRTLTKWIMDKNTAVKARLDKGEIKCNKAAEEKARDNDFFLGLESGWLYRE